MPFATLTLSSGRRVMIRLYMTPPDPSVGIMSPEFEEWKAYTRLSDAEASEIDALVIMHLESGALAASPEDDHEDPDRADEASPEEDDL
jgi:hypothetical protein